MSETAVEPEDRDQAPTVSRAYAGFAFATLVLVNTINNIDRYIFGILAPDIKSSMKLTDAELGFLLGTAFAVFYAIVGIAVGRIADQTSRARLLAIGLAAWSAMTVFGGTARSFATLGIARIGVGVGESTATPCSQTLLASYYPPHRRALVASSYLVGSFVGSMLAMVIGGIFVEHWSTMCRSVPVPGACARPGWQAALICIGLPGLPLALVVASLREPSHRPGVEETLGRVAAREVGASLPPFSALHLYRLGGAAALARNLLLATLLIGIAVLLTRLVGDPAQWSAAALGTYAIVTWAQIIKRRDRPFYALTFGSPTYMHLVIGAALVACAGGATIVWAASYAIRTLGMAPAETGVALGVTYTLSAVIGLVAGGFVADRWKRRDPRAPIWMAMISVVGAAPGLLVMVLATDRTGFLVGYAMFGIIASMSSGATVGMVYDLVLPRMRASAISIYALASTLIPAGVGPYWVGKISTLTGSLSAGLLSVELLTPVAVWLLYRAARRARTETEADRMQRAAACGEAVAA